MPIYRCTATVTGSKYLGEVNADSMEQAIERANALAEDIGVSLCHHCAEECEDPEITNVAVALVEQSAAR